MVGFRFWVPEGELAITHLVGMQIHERIQLARPQGDKLTLVVRA